MKRRNFLAATSGLAAYAAVRPSFAATPCPPGQLGVQGGATAQSSCPASSGASDLATLATSMAPGSWAQLNPSNQNAVLGVGSISGTMIHYCNSMPFNPVTRCIEILAMDHNWGSLRYARYDLATNNFVLVSGDVGLGSFTQHGYDHVEVNPFTGDLYYRQYSLNTGTIKCFRKLKSSTASFSALPTLISAGGAEQVAIGTSWWSGSFAGGGNQGSYMVFNSGNAVNSASDGQIAAFDPVSNAWFFNKSAMAPNSGSGATYHSLMEYSSVKNVAVYGGGDAAPTKLWRLASNGSFVTMPDVPAGKAVGMQRGLLVADPVTGNFLLLSAGELWELNPSGSGSWTKQTGSRVPPAGVGIPGPSTIQAVICSQIAPHGVVAYITQPQSTGATFFLYKHA